MQQCATGPIEGVAPGLHKGTHCSISFIDHYPLALQVWHNENGFKHEYAEAILQGQESDRFQYTGTGHYSGVCDTERKVVKLLSYAQRAGLVAELGQRAAAVLEGHGWHRSGLSNSGAVTYCRLGGSVRPEI